MLGNPGEDGMVANPSSVKAAMEDIFFDGDYCGEPKIPMNDGMFLRDGDPLLQLIKGADGDNSIGAMRIVPTTQDPTMEYLSVLFASLIGEQLKYRGVEAELQSLRLWDSVSEVVFDAGEYAGEFTGMKLYTIENRDGLWWTGSYWGTKQERKGYFGHKLPEVVDTLELQRCAAGFYYSPSIIEDGDAKAWVRDV